MYSINSSGNPSYNCLNGHVSNIQKMEQIPTGKPNIPFPNKSSTTSTGLKTVSQEDTTTNIPWPESGNASVECPLTEYEHQFLSIQEQEFASRECLQNRKPPHKNDVIVMEGNCTNDYSDTQLSADMCNTNARESDSTEPNIPCANDSSEERNQNTSLDIINHNTAAVTSPPRLQNQDHRSPSSQGTATLESRSENFEELEQSLKNLLEQTIRMQKANCDMMFDAKSDVSKAHETLAQGLTDTQKSLCRLETRLHQDDEYIKSLDETVRSVMNKVNNICDLIKLPATRELSDTRSTEGITDNPHSLTNPIEKSSVRQKNRKKEKHEHHRKDVKGKSNNASDVSIDKTKKHKLQLSENEKDNLHESDSVLKSSLVAPECLADRTENINTNIPLDISREQKRHEHKDTDVKSSKDTPNVRVSNEHKMTSKSALDNTEKVRTSHSKHKNGAREEGGRRSKSSSRKSHSLKCNELGFKYRKTRQQVDNRLKVMRQEVVLQSSAMPPIFNNNIKMAESHDLKRRDTSYHGTTGASYSQFSTSSLDFPTSKFFTPSLDLSEFARGSGFGMDAVAATEQDIAISEQWVDKANQERRNGAFQRAKRGTGPDTVLLLDTSGSMRGQPFTDMIRIAREIIEGIRDLYYTRGIEENIGIAVLGQETTVLKHLTLDYTDVLSSLDTLQPGGPSSFAAGFLMGLAAILGNAPGLTNVLGKRLYTRMIFISDGRSTTDQATTDDEVRSSLIITKIRAVFEATLNDFATRGYRVFCVPVGNYEMVHFNDICTTTKGRIFKPNEINRLVTMTQAEVVATQHVDGMKGCTRQQIMQRLDTRTPTMLLGTPDAMEDVADYIEFLLERDIVEDPFLNVSLHEELNPNMLPIGTRVRRGPTWKFGNQDTEGPGTVVGHQRDGMLWVEWDNGIKNRYHYMPRIHDVEEVDEPRLVGDELIATGCLVKRGMDWTYNEQDGGQGNIGVVFSVTENGIVGVRWPNKKKGLYKYGAEGKFEVEICDPATTLQTVQAPTAGSSAFERGPMNHVPSTLPSQPTRTIESYLPSVDEMNRRNASSLSSESYNSDTSKHDARHPSNEDTTPQSEVDIPPSTQPKWQYSGNDGQFKDYPSDVNDKIEKAYSKKQTRTTVIRLGGVGYRLLFTKMVQIDIETKISVHIRRIEAS